MREPSLCLRSTVPVAEGCVFVDMTVTGLLSIHTLAVTLPLCIVFDSPLWGVICSIVVNTLDQQYDNYSYDCAFTITSVYYFRISCTFAHIPLF